MATTQLRAHRGPRFTRHRAIGGVWSGVTSVLGVIFFLSTKMLPYVAAIVRIYIIAEHIGLLDNDWALVILYTGFNLPLAVWMIRSFFLEVPRELLEAARIDGGGLRVELTKVIMPIVAPG